MGQFNYLINEDHKIYVEAYQSSASGNDICIITELEKLGKFMEYCYHNQLNIRCVNEGFFEQDSWTNWENYQPYKDISEIDAAN